MAGKLAPRSGAGRGTRGAGREGGGSEGGPASLAAARARARWSPHTHAQTRARARAHTPKKSSVTCSLSKPALAPGKTYPFLVSTPTSGSSSLRRHPYNIPTMFKKKSVHWVLYIYICIYTSVFLSCSPFLQSHQPCLAPERTPQASHLRRQSRLRASALHSGRVSSTGISVSRDPLRGAKLQALSPPRAVCSRALPAPEH